MNLCPKDHAEVCYDGRVCPVCLEKDHTTTVEKIHAQVKEQSDAEIAQLQDSIWRMQINQDLLNGKIKQLEEGQEQQ